ncbi:MAG TPA: GNAT family N-acetyltransferase [Candidatus Acidoferrales bacterium]|nr:GNAT family N-acetyltransferase [Candidatus Acidoferrales bacterium]
MTVIPRESINTARLVLEPVSHAHDADLYRASLTSRPELLPWMPWAVDVSMETQVAFVEERGIPGWDRGSPAFAITEHGVAIGVIGLDEHAEGEYEIHYWLQTDRTGRGYVTEAAQALLAWARESLGATRILLNAGMLNRRSLAVAERLGFTRDGELEGGMTGGSVAIFPAYTHHRDL